MGFIIGGQATGPGVAYDIIQTPTSSSGTSTVTAMARDSSGNMFVVGNMNTDFANDAGDMFLAKYDSSNTLQWQKSLTWTLASTAYRIEQVNDIYIDSSNNIFITGSIRGLQYSYYGGNPFFAKLDSSGSFLMQKELTQQPQGGVANQWYYGGMGRRIITDSSGNIYVALGGRVIAGTLIKLNSSGVIQWQKCQEVANGTNAYLCHTFNGLVLDESNGYVYTLSSPEEFNNAGVPVITVNKFNSSTGASVWRTNFESAVNTYLPWGSGLVKGPSGDLYFALACDHPSHNIYIGKVSASTGSVIWTQKFATTVSDYSTGIAVDSSENIYVSGYTVGSTTGAVLILKYDSSGSLLWQRNIYATPAASFDTAGKIYVESAGGFSVMLKINGKPMIAKLPVDGTMTGTYSINGVSVLYGASSGTNSTGTLTVTQPGDYYLNSSHTIADTTINIATSSLTTAGPTAIGSGAGSPIGSGAYMSGVAGGMYLSDYVAPTFTPTTKAIMGFGNRGPENTTNLISSTGIVSADSSGVGTARETLAASSYGGDKALFGYGKTGAYAFNVTAVTNLVSNTGVMAADTTGVGTTRHALAAAGYGTDKAIFGYGLDGSSTISAVTNLVSNTGVVATDTAGVGAGRYYLAAASYGGDKALFGFGQLTGTSVYTTNRSLVSNTGVVAAQTGGSGTGRSSLAAASYGNDKAIFGFGSTSSGAAVYYNASNKVSNTGVVAADTAGVGTSRMGLAGTGYGSDKGFFGFGNPASGVLKTVNLVSNTGVVASDTSSGGTARSRLTAAGYSTSA